MRTSDPFRPTVDLRLRCYLVCAPAEPGP